MGVHVSAKAVGECLTRTEWRQVFRASYYLFLVRNKHRKAIVSMWIRLSAIMPSDWISNPDVQHLPLIPSVLWRLFLEEIWRE